MSGNVRLVRVYASSDPKVIHEASWIQIDKGPAIIYGQVMSPQDLFNHGLQEDGRRPREARRWYLLAIESGHQEAARRAAFNLALIEDEDGRVDEARHWYGRAGTPRAMFNLGVLEEGCGNAEAARHWYAKAVESGHAEAAPRAMFNLGLLEDRAGDRTRARGHYLMAVGSGHEEAAARARANLEALSEHPA
ncbi:hypothetical protein GCM10010404_57330 [Nonomuraea africana]